MIRTTAVASGMMWSADRRPAMLALAIPVAIVSVLGILLVPLPTWLVDLLICANLASSLFVLLVVLGVEKPSDLTLFPSVLLVLTLVRIALNVATTRLILTVGEAAAADPPQVAGQCIWVFGQLVAAGDLLAGAVVFGILCVVQFVVVTRGASRIGEVAARFALDALPGRQMAIDAELRSAVISPAEAQRKREQLSEEADFFAGLDGVGKYLRGDALACLLIVGINLAGGLYVGLVRLGWSLEATLQTFTLLTIGDALASQLPALLCAVAAGLLVTRGGKRGTFVAGFRTQFLWRPSVHATAALVILLLALTPLPTAPLVALSAVMGLLAVRFARLPRPDAAALRSTTLPVGANSGLEGQARPSATPADAPAIPARARAGLLSIPAPLELQLGSELAGLAKRCYEQIPALREQIRLDLGLPLPKVFIRIDPLLGPAAYQILLHGERIAEGMVFPGGRLLPGVGSWDGAVCDPLDGRPARWEAARSGGQDRPGRHDSLLDRPNGLSPLEVIMRHLHRVVLDHADELLTLQSLGDLLDELTREHGRLMDETRPILERRCLLDLCRRLLREGVAMRDLPRIVETAAGVDPAGVEPGKLPMARLAAVRTALRRTIVGPLIDDDGVLRLVQLPPSALDGQPAGSLAEGVRRRCPVLPAQRPVILVLEPLQRLRVWEELHRAGLNAVCLSPQELPPGLRTACIASIDTPASPNQAAPLPADPVCQGAPA